MVRPKTSVYAQFAGKEYKDGINEVIKTTPVRPGDFDVKALALLDVLQQRGRSKEACDFLKQTLKGMARDRIQNWRGYVYTLLRGFDAEAYASMKADRGGDKKKAGGKDKDGAIEAVKPVQHTFNQAATEFVPGQSWYAPDSAAQKKQLHLDVPEFVPGQIVWAGAGEVKPFTPAVAPAEKKPAVAPQAKAGGRGSAKQKATVAPEARSEDVHGTTTTKEATVPAKTDDPSADTVQEDAAVAASGSEPWYQNKGVIIAGVTLAMAALTVPLVQKRARG